MVVRAAVDLLRLLQHRRAVHVSLHGAVTDMIWRSIQRVGAVVDRGVLSDVVAGHFVRRAGLMDRRVAALGRADRFVRGRSVYLLGWAALFRRGHIQPVHSSLQGRHLGPFQAGRGLF